MNDFLVTDPPWSSVNFEPIERRLVKKLSIKPLLDFQSTAKLRRDLHDRRLNRWFRGTVYAELLRRRHARNR